MAQCDSCRKQVKGKLTTTVTGRQICTSCNRGLLGAAAGTMSAGAGSSTEAQIASAVSTQGFFKRLRRRSPDPE